MVEEFSARDFGRLEAEVEGLTDMVKAQGVKIDAQGVKIDHLLELAARSKGANTVLISLASIAGALMSWMVDHLVHR
jgi:hypothetical protein